MAKQNQSDYGFSLDRRKLLTIAAAVTVGGAIPTEHTTASFGIERLRINGTSD
jgi:hypothetical protein